MLPHPSQSAGCCATGADRALDVVQQVLTSQKQIYRKKFMLAMHQGKFKPEMMQAGDPAPIYRSIALVPIIPPISHTKRTESSHMSNFISTPPLPTTAPHSYVVIQALISNPWKIFNILVDTDTLNSTPSYSAAVLILSHTSGRSNRCRQHSTV
jgi:hypothetical protein